MAGIDDKTTKAQTEALGKLHDALEITLNVTKQLNDAMKTMADVAPTKSLKDLTIDLGGSKDATSELGDAFSVSSKIIEMGAKKGAKAFSGFGKVMDSVKDSLGKKFPVTASIALGAVEGLIQGFKNVVAVSKSLIGLFSNLVGTAFRFGAAVASIPFKLFDVLIDAAESTPWALEIQQAIENVRKEFGDLSKNAAKTALDLSNSFKGFSETGLSTFQVFGTIAERIDYARELVKGFGMTLDSFMGEFKDHGGRLAAYQKALGITAEEFKSFGDLAIATGRELQDVSKEVSKYTLQFSGGVIDKRFSRQIQKAIADVKHFAGATVTQIGRATAYAKSLNVELEKLTGTLDAFETFDTAADNAAKLSQSFGMTVDSFKLMKAQSPDEQVDMLRKSLFAAGKDAANMNRQELAILSSTTGLDAATAKLVFSQKNRGKSLQEIQKEANKAKNTEMSQVEVMKSLSGAIERLVKQMETLKGGFFDVFIQGFMRGAQNTAEFWRLMNNIKHAILGVWYVGVGFGRWFMSEKGFPGMYKIVKSLADLFDPMRYKKLFSGMVSVFQKGIGQLREGKLSLPGLMDELKEHFFEYFNSGSGPGKELLEGVKTTMRMVSTLIAAGVKWAAKELANGFTMISDLITGKKKLSGMGAMGESLGFLGDLIKPIYDAVKESWPDLWLAFRDMMGVVWDKLKIWMKSPEVQGYLKQALFGLSALLLTPAVLNGVASGFLAFFSQIMLKGLIGGVSTAVESALPMLERLLASSLGKVLGGATVVGLIAAMSVGVSSGMTKFKGTLRKEFSESQSIVSAGTAGLIDMLTFGLMSDETLTKISVGVASIGKSIEGQLDKILPNLGKTVMDRIAASFKTLSGLGDIIIGIFKGDEDRIANGLLDTFTGLINILWTTIELQIVKFPALLLKGLSYAFETIAPIVPKLIGNFLKSMGLESVGNAFIEFGNVTKSVFHLIRDGIDFLVAGFDFLVTGFRFVVKDMSKSGDWIKERFTAVFGWVGDKFTWLLEKFGIGKETIDLICKGITSAWIEVKTVVGEIINSIVTKLSMLSKLFDMLGGVFKNMTSWMKSTTSDMKKGLDPEEMKKTAQTTAEVASNAIQEGLSAAEKNSGITDKIIVNQNKSIDELLANAASQQKKVQDLAAGFSKLETQGLVSSMKVVGGITDAANELDRALSDGNVNKLNVRAKLQRVADSVGLKNQKYTISNKMVQITLDLTVVMDAGEVEKVMIQRKSSVIRDRLNHVPEYTKSQITGNEKIPSTLNGVVNPVSGNEFEA